MQSLQSTFHAVRAHLTPVLAKSEFQERGVLTVSMGWWRRSDGPAVSAG
jgi:hypothetical protein